VNAQLILKFAVITVLLLIGCDAPNAEFVYSQRTGDLISQARAPVEDTVDGHFGTPSQLIAWLRFSDAAIRFGRLQGQVMGPGSSSSRFKVSLDLSSVEDDLTADDLEGLGLLWITGKYTDAVTENRKGKETRIDFQATGFDASTLELSVNAQLESPPDSGDKFLIVGHVLLHGQKNYMHHCMHCHGVTGDGNGPTANYLNPRPRDYRLGIFKFTSTKQADRASRDDLKRIVRRGIHGTYMPSFMLLEEEKLDSIIEYVRWLAIRGEFEKILVTELAADYSKEEFNKQRQRWKDSGRNPDDDPLNDLKGFLDEDFRNSIDNAASNLDRLWARAEEKSSVVIPSIPRTDPEKDPHSIARGRELYLSAKTKCAGCHGIAGRGDGPQTESVQKNKLGKQYDEPGLFDDWGNKLKPRDLTRGIYRGGRRPIDIYRRIYAGIKGTPMPAFGGTALNDNEIWDLVNYVMSVPFPRRLPTSSPNSHGSTPTKSASKPALTASRSD